MLTIRIDTLNEPQHPLENEVQKCLESDLFALENTTCFDKSESCVAMPEEAHKTPKLCQNNCAKKPAKK